MDDPLEEEYRRAFEQLSRGDTHPCDQIDGASGEFGLAQSNPIPCFEPQGERSYCSKLLCPHGHSFWFHRLGSDGEGPDGHVVDMIEMLCFAGETRIVLYFDMYHHGVSRLVPKDLGVGANLSTGDVNGWYDGFPESLPGYDSRNDLRRK